MNYFPDPLENEVYDFVKFEAETSLVYPWKTPLLQIIDLVPEIANRIRKNAPDGYDTDDIYDAVDEVCGIAEMPKDPGKHFD